MTIPVHPHVRGEEAAGSATYNSLLGSPPRAWGRVVELAVELRLFRFTPTCVGKSTLTGLSLLFIPVHPHVRGEEVDALIVGAVAFGSPPRAWGRGLSGILASGSCTVHPHLRGEETGPIVVARHEIERVSPSRAAISRSTIKGIPS